jgi:hypothetical protein
MSSLRETMPICAAFIDDLREAFGKDAIDGVIRRGLAKDCEPALRFYAAEGGYEIGQRCPPGRGITAAKMVLIPPEKSADVKKSARAGRR